MLKLIKPLYSVSWAGKGAVRTVDYNKQQVQSPRIEAYGSTIKGFKDLGHPPGIIWNRITGREMVPGELGREGNYTLE